MDIVERLKRKAIPGFVDDDVIREAADTIQQQAERIKELEAARIAYASEFPLNADGEPDVGSVHANIRELKQQLAEVVEYARAKDVALMECAKVNSLDRPMHCQTIVNDAMALPLPKAMR